MNGLSDSVIGLYSSFDPDLKVELKVGKRFNVSSISFDELEKIPGVTSVVQSVEEIVLLKYGDNQEVATIKGVSNHFPKLAKIEDVIVEGSYNLKAGSGIAEAVVGSDLAIKLGINLNAQSGLRAYCPNLEGVQGGGGPGDFFKEYSFLTTGVFDINGDFNGKYVLVALDKANQFLDLQGEISAIEIGIDSNYAAEDVQLAVQNFLGESFSVKTRFEQNEFLFKSINAEKWITLLILSLVIVLAIFNVIGSLTMLIIDKTKDIFVLQSMGAERKDVKKIFWLVGFFISLTGSLIGVSIGAGLCLLQDATCFYGYGSGGRIECFPVNVFLSDAIIILFVVNLIGGLASLIPIVKIKAIQ